MLDIDWIDLVLYTMFSVAFLACLVLVASAIYWRSRGTAFGAWWRRLNNPIAYRPSKHENHVPISPMGYDYMGAERKAAYLLQTTLGLTNEQVQAFRYSSERIRIVGGATGRIYEIAPRFNLPIHVPAERLYLCAGPFNGHALPRPDIALAQALYLSCPTTERDFLKLCNKTQF